MPEIWVFKIAYINHGRNVVHLLTISMQYHPCGYLTWFEIGELGELWPENIHIRREWRPGCLLLIPVYDRKLVNWAWGP